MIDFWGREIRADEQGRHTRKAGRPSYFRWLRLSSSCPLPRNGCGPRLWW